MLTFASNWGFGILNVKQASKEGSLGSNIVRMKWCHYRVRIADCEHYVPQAGMTSKMIRMKKWLYWLSEVSTILGGLARLRMFEIMKTPNATVDILYKICHITLDIRPKCREGSWDKGAFIIVLLGWLDNHIMPHFQLEPHITNSLLVSKTQEKRTYTLRIMQSSHTHLRFSEFVHTIHGENAHTKI